MTLKLLEQQPATPAQQEVMSEPVETQFLMDTEMAPAHRTPIKDFDDKSLEGQALASTRHSVDLDTLDEQMKPQVEIATPVFADQGAAEQMLDQAQPLSFNQAFRDARYSGKAEFEHMGSMFHTRQKDESESNWQEVLKNQTGPLLTDFIAGFERERPVSEIPPVLEAGNKISPWSHPLTEDRQNVRLMSIGGPHPTDPSLDEPVSIVPSMKDGRQMTEEDTVTAAREAGMHLFPQTRTVEQATEKIKAIHAHVSKRGILTKHATQPDPSKSELDFLMGGDDDDIMFAPTPKQKSIMEAPTETKFLPGPEYLDVTNKRIPETNLAPELFKVPGRKSAEFTREMLDQTDEWNTMRGAEGKEALKPSSGFRNAAKQVRTMINAIKKSPSLAAALNEYKRDVYQQPIKDWFANKTEANLEKIREVRRMREEEIASQKEGSGHAHYDAMDFGAAHIKTRAEALETVAWLNAQGKKATLMYWDSEDEKGTNAHIHVEGMKH